LITLLYSILEINEGRSVLITDSFDEIKIERCLPLVVNTHTKDSIIGHLVEENKDYLQKDKEQSSMDYANYLRDTLLVEESMLHGFKLTTSEEQLDTEGGT